MKLIVLFCIVSAVVALPRTKQTAEVYREPLELESDAEPVDIGNFDDQNPEGDAESIPGTNFFVLRFRPFFHSFGFPEFRPQLPQLPRLPDFPALPPRRSFFDDFFSRDYQPEPEQPEIPEPNPFFKTFFDMMKPSGFGGPNFDSLPGNYSNSTHDIMDIDGTKVAVNQTIKKTSGNNFHNFFHFKVVQVLPDGEILAEETPGEEQPVVDEISPEQDAGFDGDLPEEDITVDEPLPEDTRAVEEVLPESDPEIVMRRGDTTFDPEANQYDFERDPQRENEVVPVENYAPEVSQSL